MNAPTEKNPAAVETAGLEIAIQRQPLTGDAQESAKITTAAGAVEEAAPIPAEVWTAAKRALRLADKCDSHEDFARRITYIARAILADRASQEERIREDERDALFLAAERAQRRHIRSWIGMRGGMFPADRARHRGGAS